MHIRIMRFVRRAKKEKQMASSTLVDKITQLLLNEGCKNFTVTVSREAEPVISMGQVIDFNTDNLPKIEITFE